MYNMIKKMGINVNIAEASVLVASANGCIELLLFLFLFYYIILLFFYLENVKDHKLIYGKIYNNNNHSK